jgi:hypothetical protein
MKGTGMSKMRAIDVLKKHSGKVEVRVLLRELSMELEAEKKELSKTLKQVRKAGAWRRQSKEPNERS